MPTCWLLGRRSEVDDDGGEKSRGDAASCSSHALFYTLRLCGEQTNALGVLFCSGRLWCVIRSEGTDNRRCSPPIRQPPSLKVNARGTPDSADADSDRTTDLIAKQFQISQKNDLLH